MFLLAIRAEGVLVELPRSQEAGARTASRDLEKWHEFRHAADRRFGWSGIGSWQSRQTNLI